jgi:hypothetical protein
LNWILHPLQGIAILRSTGLPRHPEYHIAREEKIRYLPITSSEVAYLVRSRAMSARRQKWKAETVKLKNATSSGMIRLTSITAAREEENGP